MGDDFFGGNDDFDFNDLFGVGGTGNNSNDILNDAMGGFTAASTTAAAAIELAAAIRFSWLVKAPPPPKLRNPKKKELTKTVATNSHK